MIPFLNEISFEWYNYFFAATLQNSIYIGIILLLMYIFRNKDIRFLRLLAIIGFIKLLIPPFIIIPAQKSFISEINLLTITESFQKSTVTGAEPLSFQAWLMMFWIIMSFLLLTIVLIRTIRLHRIYKNAVYVDISKLSDHPLANQVKFYQSDKNHSPLLMGLIQKKVVLPKDWRTWSSSAKTIAIAHELNHIRNRDPWYNLLRSVLLSLNFFNPLVWMLSKRLITLSEMVCDDSTIDCLNSSTTSYSKQLIDISVKAIEQQPDPALSLAFSESYTSMKNRISYQLSKKEGAKMEKMSRNNIIFTMLAFLMMIVFSWQCESSEVISEMGTSSDAGKSSEKVYTYSEVTVKPEMIKNISPRYPDDARKSGLTGKVVISVTIDIEGNVSKSEIYKALKDSIEIKRDKSGNYETKFIERTTEITSLDRAALEAAKKCKFKPAEHDGKKVSAIFNIPFQFKLK